jgi:hypothetical protein
VIRRAAIRPRPQKAHQHDLLDARSLRGFNDIKRAFNVNALVSVIAKLTIDAGAVRNCITTCKRFA